MDKSLLHGLKDACKRCWIIVFFTMLAQQSFAQIPTASFSADSTEGCLPLTVHFTNTSLQATNYFWDFGNGNTSTLPNPQTVYLTPGSYCVKLIAYNNVSVKSDTLTLCNYINVVAFPTVNFSANVTSGCNPLTVTFTNTSSNFTTCFWDFGDGYSSTLTNPVHTYTTSGTYTVKLIAYSAYGCSKVLTRSNYITVYGKPQALLTANPTSTCDPNQVFQFSSASTGIAAYQWDFGQPAAGAANTSTLSNPTYVYGAQGNYQVSLIVIDNNGCSDTLVKPNYISIGNALTPTFTWNKSAGCAPLAVTFTAPAISNVTSYAWTFGDPASGAANTSSLQNPIHTYNAPGSYSVSLFVTTSSGCNGGVTLNNIIQVDQLPVPNFTANATQGCAPKSIAFSNTTVGAATYLWEFGDGTTSTLAAPSHTYGSAGTYTVILHAYTTNGCEATKTRSSYITIYSVSANFNTAPPKGCAPLNALFTPTNTTGVTSYQWNFGDPASGALNTSTLSNPNHLYNSLGNYTVKLIVTNAFGCTDTVVKNAVQVLPPSVTYTVPDTIKGCQPLPVGFANPLTGASIFHWDFGVPWLANDTSNLANPGYTFDSVGVYTVTLNATMAGNNGLGCSQVFQPIAYVQVFPLILSPITYVQATPCAPYLIHFSDTTMDVAHWDWDFGDGTPHDTTQFPTHTYLNPGTYQVHLNIVTITGCMTSLSTTITLGMTNPIVINKHAGCHDEPFNFSLSPNTFTNIVWNFGDGTATSTSPSPTHTYNQTGWFIITLNCKGSDGCNYIFKDSILTTNPQPNFIINGPTSSCANLYINFVNTSTGATSYFWDFGDPTSSTNNSTLTNPGRNFTTPKNYTITLTASTPSCSRTISYPNLIRINRAKSNFSFTQNSICFPITAQFTDLSGPPPALAWGWNFGDGITDSTQNPIHIFTSVPNVDSISLWVRDTNGCTATKKLKTVTYKKAKFTMSSTGGCKPVTICFTDISDSGATAWQWSFGNGATSTLRNPCYTYTVDGVYTVRLITTFSSGCKDTLTMLNAVNISTPNADFNSPVVSFCAPAVATFNNLSTNATSYLWDFGDGSTSVAPTPSHVYNLPGDYTVTLIAINGTCRDTMRKVNYLHVPGTYSYFNLVSTQGCLGNLVQFTDSSLNAQTWMWNFGDGDSSTLQNPTHLYADTGSFIVSLITSDNLGCSSLYIFQNPIVVHPVPVAQAATIDTVGCNSFTTTFTQSSINATSFKWNFGDPSSGAQNTSTLTNPSHTFANAGLYQVYLVAFNNFGCSDTFRLPYKINVHRTPHAQFTSNPSTGCTPLAVSFSNSSTQLSNVSYNWNFGNGLSSPSASPQTLYTDSGTYAVTLITINDNLCRDTAQTSIRANLSPTALAITADTAGCTPHQVQFTNQSLNATSYQWNFGNGVTSTLANPTYTYTTGGNYNVTLIATNAAGCRDTFNMPALIRAKQTPKARFTNSPSSGCSPLPVTFTNTSSQTNGATYAWNFGNGMTSFSTNPAITFPDSGTFAVTLTTTNSNGCSHDTTKTIRVNKSPTAIASTNDTSGCTPYTSAFVNNSVNATTYSWNFGDGSALSTATSPTHTYINSGNYIVTMVASNAQGCKDTIVFTHQVHVNQTPIASFSSSVNSGCTPLNVTFTNTSSQITGASFNWNFGNGTTSTLTNPVIAYTDSGSFVVTLITTNANGCIDSTKNTIRVNLSPSALATTVDTVGCTPHVVHFTNQSTNATSYQWNFGNGATSIQANPTYTYTTGGNFTVTVIATNAAGCRDTFQLPTIIRAKQTPRARFNINPASGCSPLTVNFSNTSTQTSGAIYNWNFGNGLTSTLTSPTTLYADSGTFTVTLTATNSNGCFHDSTKTVRVNLSPTAIASTTDTTGCTPYTSVFTNNSLNATSYSWNFGDGSALSAATTPSHTYNTSGTYTVTMIASNAQGCRDTIVFPYHVLVNQTPTAAFTSSATVGCSPMLVNFTNTSTQNNGASYFWNFGNGTTDTVANPTVQFPDSGTFVITLVTTNSNGCMDSVSHSIRVNLSPTAIASTTDTTGCTPYTSVFTNNSLNATSYSWNFGDGSALSAAATPSHTYNTSGTYTVTMIASNAQGCRDTIVFPYHVLVNQTPTAAFTSSATVGCSPMLVNFTNTSTQNNGASYFWNFGNGTTDTVANPTVQFPDSGTFVITLVTTNSNGCMDSVSHSIRVNLSPTAIASTTDTTGCTPYTSVFTNNSLNATSYSWNFGDGSALSAATTPSHTYNTSGTYTVTMIASNAQGCRDTIVFPYHVLVNQTPTAAFTSSATVGCSPMLVNFTNTSTQNNGASYFWNFGNGTTDTVANPTVQFPDSGTFIITLVTTNSNGCMDSVSHSIRVNLSPTANGFTSDTTGCSPYLVTFTSSSLNADSIKWYFGNGQSTTGDNVQFTYTQSGIYQPYLVAYNAAGCRDTFYLPKTIHVRQTPHADFTVDQNASCPGYNFTFSNLSTDTIAPVYQWTIGGFTTNAPNFSIPLLNPGFYSVGLTVTNINGCSASEVKSNYIQVYDTIPPPQDPIYSVSVESNSQVKIIWANSAALDLGAYKLWRLDPASGNYVNVYTDNNPANASMNPESFYIENGLNTLANTYTYKIQTLDRCTKAIPLNALKAHTTINVSAQKNGSGIDVTWTPYGGCPVATYEITRTEVSNGSTALIAIVPGTQLFYHDTTMLCPDVYSYRINATDLCGIPYTSLSDTAAARPDYSLEQQQPIIVRSTVVNNNFVLTEWSEPLLHPERVGSYNIYRSTDSTGSQYVLLATVSSGITSYEDYNVYVNEQNYYYKIEAVSDCNLVGTPSAKSSSILLQSHWEYATGKLWWTKYDKWDSGVERYEIEKYNWNTGQWEKVKTVPGNATQTEIDE